MVETLTTTVPVDTREERRINEVMPQALEALLSILGEGAAEASTDQIDERIKKLPSYKTYKPVGGKTLSVALSRLVDEGKVSGEQRESFDTTGKFQTLSFYGKPKLQESQADPVFLIAGYSAGAVDGIPGLTQAIKATQKS